MASRSIRSSINRLLLIRLGFASLSIALVFAAIAFVTEKRRVGDAVLDLARIQGQRFNHYVLPLLDKSGPVDAALMQQRLSEYAAAGGTGPRDGHFIIVRMYDARGHELARLSDRDHPDIAAVEQRMDAVEHRLEPGSDYERVDARIEGAPYVGIAMPLADTSGKRVAHFEAVFALSADAIERFRGNIARTAFYVVAICLLTAAAIYPVIRNLVGRLTQQSANLLSANLQTMQVLGSAIAKRDSDTDAHNYRVTIYSVRLAERLGLEPDVIKRLVKGALLHDVGKLGIRDNILLKPGKLDHDEFEIMKTHVKHGLDITGRVSWLEDANDVVGGHHEKYSGDGYPLGLRGEEIPITARIFAIVDVFDALTSRRPYKEPLSFEQTMGILRTGKEAHFDPALLDAFVEIARELYDRYSSNPDARPEQELASVLDRYFTQDVEEFLS